MRRAALYARVSTRRQEQEATIESQLDRLTNYARQQAYELPAELQFSDQAVSGKQLARPGLDRLRDAAAAGAFSTLLCLSPDRLARNLGAQQVVLDELRRADVTVIFLDQLISFFFLKDVVSCCDNIRTSAENFIHSFFGDSGTSRQIFTIHHHKINLLAFYYFWNQHRTSFSARLADRITQN